MQEAPLLHRLLLFKATTMSLLLSLQNIQNVLLMFSNKPNQFKKKTNIYYHQLTLQKLPQVQEELLLLRLRVTPSRLR
jgi:hypothetical protein